VFAINAPTIGWSVIYAVLVGCSLVALSLAVNLQMQMQVDAGHSQSVSKVSLRALPVEFGHDHQQRGER
jgi:hypothetical protein